MRGKRENFFSREKKFSLSPRAPLSLSRKAGNFFIYLYLPVSGTEPFIYLPVSGTEPKTKKESFRFRKLPFLCAVFSVYGIAMKLNTRAKMAQVSMIPSTIR